MLGKVSGQLGKDIEGIFFKFVFDQRFERLNISMDVCKLRSHVRAYYIMQTNFEHLNSINNTTFESSCEGTRY
jgi:hypothetical protein